MDQDLTSSVSLELQMLLIPISRIYPVFDTSKKCADICFSCSSVCPSFAGMIDGLDMKNDLYRMLQSISSPTTSPEADQLKTMIAAFKNLSANYANYAKYTTKDGTINYHYQEDKDIPSEVFD